MRHPPWRTGLGILLATALCSSGCRGGSSSPAPGTPTSPSGEVAPPIPSGRCAEDPVEPVWDEDGASAARVKSPAPHMHFTAGAPLRILADARDTNAWNCPPGHPPYVCPGTQVRFFVDGQPAGSVPPSATHFNLWELRLPKGLPAGDHVLTVDYVPYDPGTGGGGTPINGLVPVTIHVDAAPAHGATVTLAQDLVLEGTTDLDWTDKTVVGNGFKVTAAAGYSGRVTIRDAFVTGLGSFDTPGLDVTTSGSVAIERSTFEATGAMRLDVQGSGALLVKQSELRANNLFTYISSDPSVPVVLELGGDTTGAKIVQGNRIGGGILLVRGDGWQIGGLGAGEGNILMGARAVLELVDASNARIQGNYLLHDYHGGFSQGFNLWLQGSSGSELAEHNVVIGGSWPIQSFGGEFRYNLVVDSGHNFWRSATDDTRIHHNLFVHATGTNTGYNGAILVYGGESGLDIFNNTFDAGGAVSDFDAPAFTIGAGSLFRSIRNNLFTAFSDVSATYGKAFVSADGGAVSAPRVTSADYNGWYNPLASGSARYLPGIARGTPGAHDVQADPKLSGKPEIPFAVPQGCVWLGTYTTGHVLARYRHLYLPAGGSPLLGAGDPADGLGTVIGAIGPDGQGADQFGRVVP